MTDPQPRRLILDDQICFALYAATNAITRAYRPLLGKLGLTYPQYLVMLVLWQDGPSKSGQIARRLGLAQNAVTPLLDRLEAANLVERRRDAFDHRVVKVRLTEAGEALEAEAARASDSVLARTAMEKDAVGALHGTLFDLIERLEKPSRAPQRPS